jgi:sugar phosphate isomerase/epimerase
VHVFVAVSTRNFSELSFEDACAQIIDLEFDRIELWLDDRGPQLRVADVADDSEAFVTRYREATRLSPAAITIAHDVSPDAIRGLAKTAKQLRITQITLPAADLGTPFNAEIERLRTLAGITAQDGIRTSIRTQRGTLTEDPHTAVELCQAVPGLGISLDPSHYLKTPSPDRAMDLVIPHTFHIHLRDSTADSLQVQVGLGELDYSRLISQLRRVNYTRALSNELLPDMLGDLQRPLELRKMRMLLESLL